MCGGVLRAEGPGLRHSIFSIYSNNKDMAGFSQQGKGQFFNLQMPDQAPDPVHGINHSGAGGPYIRNLLFWEPGLQISGEGRYILKFNTPDSPGTYVISLRGDAGTDSYVLLYQAQILVK